MRFEVVAFEPPEPDPYAPTDDEADAEPAADGAPYRDGDGFNWRNGQQEGMLAR